MLQTKKDIIAQLQKDILQWQGFNPPTADNDGKIGLGPIENVFPNGVFPRAAIHEFLSAEREQAAACSGFISILLKELMQHGSACIFISTSRTLFPPALKTFGINPDRVIFIDLKREKDVLWTMEEALKCEGIAAVIAEIRAVNFTQSRRLQLAVEQSKITGFILRTDPNNLKITACTARWKITPLPSGTETGLPGVGFPRWNIELLKVRNGNPGSWKMEWSAGVFKQIFDQRTETKTPAKRLKIG